YYYSVNRGKLSATVDLRKADGVTVLFDLARHCDVVLENFAPGTMERFGIGYAALSAVNPRIVLCSISGFGQSGPMASAPAYDIVAQALGGTMSITGPADGDPTRCGVSIGDLAAALYGVIAILSALRLRDRTGQGRHLDIAMLDCQVALLEDALARYSATGKVPRPLGSRHPSITPFQQFRASDGYFVAGAGNELLWERFCDAIGRAELKSDPRFKLNADRTAHHGDLEENLDRHFAKGSRDHWLRALGDAGVPCAPIADVAEVTRNPHLAARGMILRANHPSFDGLIVPGSPLKTAAHEGETPAMPDTHAPALGEHTDRVLREIAGYGPEKIAALRDSGVI